MTLGSDLPREPKKSFRSILKAIRFLLALKNLNRNRVTPSLNLCVSWHEREGKGGVLDS